ncbi:MAG TPA: hypothetical protein VMI54_20610 [Polyangiaceae bacterium]|nr:hypothetical protein [Polyangiaceae bacterium]
MKGSFVLGTALVAAWLVSCTGSSDGGGAGGAGGTGGASGSGGAAASGGKAGKGAAGSGGEAGGDVAGSGGDTAVGAAGAGNGGQSGAADAAGGTGGTAGGASVACNDVVNGAPLVNKDHDPAAPPKMTGGTIADGTYYLTKVVQYNGENGNTAQRETWVISGNTIEVVNLDGTRYSGTYTTSGHELTLTLTCPASAVGMVPVFSYTATSTQIVTLQPDDANEAHTMTLQTATTGAGGAGGEGGDGTAGVGGAAPDPTALCTSPPSNTAPQIDDAYSTSAMPASGTATGGSLEGGTYFMTAITDYESGDSGGTHKDTMVLDAGASTFVVVEVNGGVVKPPIAGTFVASGHTFTQNLICPQEATGVVEYTSASGELTIYNYDAKSVSTWAKQ